MTTVQQDAAKIMHFVTLRKNKGRSNIQYKARPTLSAGRTRNEESNRASDKQARLCLNDVRKRDLVLRDVGREVHVLQKHITDEPLRRAANLAARDARDAVARGVVGVDGREEQVAGVNLEDLSAETQSELCSRGAGDREPALSVALRTGDLSMHGFRVGGRGNDERGAGVEDRSATIETQIIAIDGDCTHRAFPEPLGVHVGERRTGVRVKFS